LKAKKLASLFFFLVRKEEKGRRRKHFPVLVGQGTEERRKRKGEGLKLLASLRYGF